MTKITRKIESYLVTHNGVKVLIPLQGANTWDQAIAPLFRWEGSYLWYEQENIFTSLRTREYLAYIWM
ncbi:MAG: hypothetical protein RQ885_01190 [Desulfurococcales archaeon]|jgi:hypothetical protein|nr:hypothetical protein [Desulfurococcales archaeon]